MKKVAKFTLIILAICFTKLLLDILINSVVISNYNNGKYSVSLVKLLYVLNINQPYIPYYNEGTILYQLGKYEEATQKFETALEKKPTNKYVCDIRTNLSLSIIAQVDETNCDTAPNDLKKAREVLEENSCSTDDETSESLYNEIKNLEKKVKEKCQSEESDPEESEDPEEEQPEEPEEQPSTPEEELREIQQEAEGNRQEQQEREQNHDYHFSEEGRW